ncbi:melatonin receptor type 1B-B [Amyelois transitella]|uniref:melatonin receptor type 1B-B n=1 Tax=Amyelois transitella TaxID=680683 RepID=UPI00298FFA67|nr:melatonin receptor type 1B-B [Amyelois transitella]
MHGLNQVLSNSTRFYSPVTLSHEWPTLSRLLMMVFCSCLGTTINGFFVAAFFVEHTLKKVGNVFLACIGLADLIVTTAVMPVSAVVLLSAGQWDTIPVCRALHFLTEASTYSYSLFFTLVAIETYYRLGHTAFQYDHLCVSLRVGIVSVLVFAVCFITAGVGVYMDLDYDYCQRRHHGDYTFRMSTFIIFHAVPFVITFFGLFCSCFKVRRRAKKQAYYKRSQQYERDFSTTNLNITVFLLYAAAWTPYLVIALKYPNASDTKFYHCVWIGVCRSVFTSFLYSAMNRNFRRAFAHLFYYCCCKSTLTGSFSSRHRRALEYKSATGDVRVHIMHQAVNSNSPQRASSSRETQEL